jgi:hypothetical protein
MWQHMSDDDLFAVLRSRAAGRCSTRAPHGQLSLSLSLSLSCFWLQQASISTMPWWGQQQLTSSALRSSFRKSWLAGPATAVTCSPHALASCTAMWPTPPEAPRMRAFWPARGLAPARALGGTRWGHSWMVLSVRNSLDVLRH